MYTIGELSKIVKISVDALRFYDEIVTDMSDSIIKKSVISGMLTDTTAPIEVKKQLDRRIYCQ